MYTTGSSTNQPGFDISDGGLFYRVVDDPAEKARRDHQVAAFAPTLAQDIARVTRHLTASAARLLLVALENRGAARI